MEYDQISGMPRGCPIERNIGGMVTVVSCKGAHAEICQRCDLRQAGDKESEATNISQTPTVRGLLA